MKRTLFAAVLLTSTSAWASGNMHPMFTNSTVQMFYPSVSSNYLVYNQRVNHQYQTMRFNKNDLNAPALDVSAMTEKETVRNGIALSNGEIGYISNRLGYFTPWLAQTNGHTSFNSGTFNSVLLPNHLEANSDGSVWVFDSTLEGTRAPRIDNQLTDTHLHNQLLGQAWRMYHEQFWTYKSAYPETKTGETSKFWQPNLFTFKRHSNEVTMLGEGFDADISPDGIQMVFVRETDGNFDLWLQDIDGSNQKRLTKNQYADLEPSFSPDGKKIAFISNRDGHGDVLQTFIYTLEIATGTIQTITEGLGVTDGGPAWLDNNTIIFHSNRNPEAPQSETSENWRLWTVTTN